MSTYNRSVTHADDAHEALRQLAYTTRRIDDPTSIYPILGDLRMALVSLAQALHQLGSFHDGAQGRQVSVNGDRRKGRAAGYQVAWDLHRAAEMLGQIANGLDDAHEAEGRITYDIRPVPPLESSFDRAEPGMSR